MVDIQKPSDVDIMVIKGNASSSFFAVKGFDAAGESTGLFVNTTDPYDGTVLLDAREGQETSRLQISASDAWTIEIKPLASARVTGAPSTITGSGDDVFIVQGTISTAHITGNSAGSYFGVIGYGSTSQLLVNTTDPYDGRVVVSSKTKVIEVKATGNWTIVFE